MDEEILIASRNFKRYRDFNKKYFNDGSGLLKVEKNALLIMKILEIEDFERTRDVFQITYDLPCLEDEEFTQQLTILVTAEEYQFRLGVTEWTKGSYAPVTTSYLWKRLILEDINSEEVEENLLKYFNMAVSKTKITLRVCKYCKKKFSGDHMISDNVCHSCAVEHEGVIFQNRKYL
jgi:hypothetical protein